MRYALRWALNPSHHTPKYEIRTGNFTEVDQSHRIGKDRVGQNQRRDPAQQGERQTDSQRSAQPGQAEHAQQNQANQDEYRAAEKEL